MKRVGFSLSTRRKPSKRDAKSLLDAYERAMALVSRLRK